jgi:Domain of unknown function (DUF4259)
VGAWGVASFENDPAGDWFFLVEEAVDPSRVIASALDSALGDADYLGLDASCEAIAAAELSASCAGHAPERLPDHVRRWVDGHPISLTIGKCSSPVKESTSPHCGHQVPRSPYAPAERSGRVESEAASTA